MRRLPKAPTPPPVPQATSEEKRAVLEAHRSLQESLTRLRTKSPNDGGQGESIKSSLLDASRSLDNLCRYLSATIETSFYNEILTSGSFVAGRTFVVPELFDMIMDYVPIPTILSFSQTCTEYKARINNSTQLQTILCLKTAPPDSNFNTPLHNMLAHAPGGGFCCKIPPFRQGHIRQLDDDNATFEVIAVFMPQGPNQRLPRIGATYRRMFVTQPPLKEMTPKLRCCPDPKVSIIREAGVTIGDLYDVAIEMIKSHRWCQRETHTSRMLENGQNQVPVEFTGTAIVRSSDSTVQRLVRDREQKEKEEKKANWIRIRNRAYALARRDAHLHALPVLTMWEWLESNPQWKSQEAGDEKGTEAEEGQYVAPVASQAAPTMIPIDAFSFN